MGDTSEALTFSNTAPQPTTLVDTDGNKIQCSNALPVRGPLLQQIANNTANNWPLAASTATKTNVNAVASNTTLLAANANRKGALFYNDSTATLYLSLGSSTASTTSYTTQVPPNALYELPSPPLYTGQIQGIWSAANGAVRVTELS